MSPKSNPVFPNNEGVDNKSLNFLINAIEKKASGDFDYLKFRQSIQALQHMDLDAATAIKSAFATASTMGLTKSKLLQTAKHYKGLLKEEKDHFDMALEKQIAERIESRRKESIQLQEVIEQYKMKILELEAKIHEFEQKVSDTDKDINDAESRINTSKEKFEEAFIFLSKTIDKDMDLIESIL